MFDFTKVDWGWGGFMTLAGMGTVFLLLALLMVVLMLIGKLDQPKPALPAPADAPALAAEAPAGETPAPTVTITDPSGLDDDTLAAIAVAVIKHADVRRAQAAPEMRSSAPGSHLFASRWVAVGRGLQNASFRRR